MPPAPLFCLNFLNAAQTEAVLFGPEGIAPKLPRGAVVSSCFTVAPDFARAMAARCDSLGLHFLDAPISGGSVKAANGKFAIMASGTAAAFNAARAMLNATAKKVLGHSAGIGSAMQAVNKVLDQVHGRFSCRAARTCRNARWAMPVAGSGTAMWLKTKAPARVILRAGFFDDQGVGQTMPEAVRNKVSLQAADTASTASTLTCSLTNYHHGGCI